MTALARIFRVGTLDVSARNGINQPDTDKALSARSIRITGALTEPATLILPHREGTDWIVINATTGNQAVTVRGPSGGGVEVPSSASLSVVTDGTVFRATSLAGSRDGVVTVEMTDTPFTDATTLAANARVVIATGSFSEMGGSDVDLVLPLDGKDRVVSNATSGGAFLWVRTDPSNAGVNIKPNESALVVNNDVDFWRVGRMVANDQSIVINDENSIWASGDFGTGTVRSGTYKYGEYDDARGAADGQSSLTTTTNGATTIATAWMPVGWTISDAVVDVIAKVVGRRIGSVSGTCSFALSGTYELNGNTLLVPVGTVDKTPKANAGASGCDANLVISGKDVLIQVTGQAGVTWRWLVVYSHVVRSTAA